MGCIEIDLAFKQSLPTEHLSFYLRCLKALHSDKCMVVLWVTLVWICIEHECSPQCGICKDIAATGDLVCGFMTVPVFLSLKI